MSRDNLSDILIFFEVARERSFTRAAAKLGMTQSALSHIIRSLEERLGVRLLNRTTRSLSPTEAGERLLERVAPRLEEVNAEIAAVRDLGIEPVGTIRITAIDHVIDSVLWPRLAPTLLTYPDLNIEMHADYRLTDIAADRYDIGVRYGDQVENDMIAVRLTSALRLMIVGSPAYFAWHTKPTSIDQLLKHNCIMLRLATQGGLHAWELEHEGKRLEARVRGQVVCSGATQMVNAALSGNGLAFVTEDMVGEHVRNGRLLSVMPDWCGTSLALHAYYSSRRHTSRVMRIVIDALRYKNDEGP